VADQARAVEQASVLLADLEREPEGVVRELEQLATRDASMALAAVTALGKVTTPHAARALQAIAESELRKDLRKEARRGLHRLKTAGVAVGQMAAERAERPAAMPPRARALLAEAWATAPHGTGRRVLYLVAERPLGGVDVLGLLLHERQGMLRASFRDTTRKRWQADLAQWRAEERAAAWTQLPPDYGSQLVGEALDLNRRSQTPVPTEFQLNRDQIEDVERPFTGALVYQEVSPGAAKLAPEWLTDSPLLLREPELADWQFEPEVVRPFQEEMLEARGTGLLVTAHSSQERVEAVLGEAIRRVVTPKVRHGLKRRLEEAAYVFLRTERQRQARLAVGAAVGVEEASTSPLLLQQSALRLDQHPFIRALMARNLEP
jgi:hypothetical protein